MISATWARNARASDSAFGPAGVARRDLNRLRAALVSPRFELLKNIAFAATVGWLLSFAIRQANLMSPSNGCAADAVAAIETLKGAVFGGVAAFGCSSLERADGAVDGAAGWLGGARKTSPVVASAAPPQFVKAAAKGLTKSARASRHHKTSKLVGPQPGAGLSISAASDRASAIEAAGSAVLSFSNLDLKDPFSIVRDAFEVDAKLTAVTTILFGLVCFAMGLQIKQGLRSPDGNSRA